MKLLRFKKTLLLTLALLGIISISTSAIYSILYTNFPVKLALVYLKATQDLDLNCDSSENYLLHKDGLTVNNLTFKHDLGTIRLDKLNIKLKELDYAVLKKALNYKLDFSINNITIQNNTNKNNQTFSEKLKNTSGEVNNTSYKIFYDKKPILWSNNLNKQDYKNHLALDINLSQQNQLKILDFLPAFNKFKINAEIEAYKINWTITAYQNITNHNNIVNITGQTNLSHYLPKDSYFKLSTPSPVLLVSNNAATIYGTPDLALSLKNKLVTITGPITLAQGNIHPPKYGKIKASKDIVFVNKQPKFNQKNKQKKFLENLELDLDINLKLIAQNTNLSFISKDLSTKLMGELELNYKETAADTHPNHDVLAQGEINLVKTRFTLYGHPLDIKQGVLSYSNSPIDNPNIKISGERQIKLAQRASRNFNIDQENIIPDTKMAQLDKATVGINISNTLNDPDIKLTSSVTMSESDQISYLLFGIPSYKVGEFQGQIILQTAKEMFGGDNNSNNKYTKVYDDLKKVLNIDEIDFATKSIINPLTGRAETDHTVILGKKFFDNLLIRYGFSVNSPVSMISGEYKLRENLKLQAQYDTNAGSGADIVYTKETDHIL
ncbi:MAG: translocation/assembly module TamB domain-containing protein [Gammaproteobacteria bacterium]|nr:translocation/assembly module TamB domain-containing protein [Gammaproteobacteria bacterium]